MVDPEFNKRDDDFYHEYISSNRIDIDKIREKYKVLRSKALKLLNDDLHGKGHEGSIGGMDVYDDELWKYLDGEEKELFNKYAKFLDFDWGFKPQDIFNSLRMRDSIENDPSHKENYHVKKFKDIVKESKLITEGLRFNTTYLSLPSGEYNIIDVLKEIRELEVDLTEWFKGGWQTITAVDREHKEIIPMADFNPNGLKNKK